MKKIMFCHFGRYKKDNFYRIYNLAFYSSKKNNVTLFTSSSKISFIVKSYKISDQFRIILFPSFFFSGAYTRSGFGILNTLIRTIYALISNYDIVFSDSNQRFTSGIPCYLSKIINNSQYYAEWWDFYGKGGLFDSKKGLKKILGYYERFTEVPCKNSADIIITLSSEMLNRSIDLGINRNRLLKIPGGSDVDNIPYLPRGKYKQKYGFNENSFVFGFVGINNQEIDDIIPFLKLFYRIKEENIFSNLEWFSTGDTIISRISEFKVGHEYHNFNYLSYNQYAELLSCSDCFISLLADNLQNNTRWPNKIGDYFAAGRPILVSPIGELKSLKKELLAGLIFVKNSEEIKSEMIKLIQMQDKDLEILGQTNRCFAENTISWEKRSLLLPFNQLN